jgi:hypothetical protein
LQSFAGPGLRDYEEFAMEQVGTNQDRLGGPYMIQDRDHLGDPGEPARKAHRGARQSEQSHTGHRQQGGSDQNVSGQQGGEKSRRRSR